MWNLKVRANLAPWNEAQTLMDDLWNCGLRPTEGTGSAGSLKATEKHLNDMRTIVKNQLDIELTP